MTSQTPSQIIDTPNQHNMFMLGTKSIYLCHMPMFTMEDHRYQLTLKAHLDPASTELFLREKDLHPNGVFNLVNLESDKFTIPDVANGNITSFPASVYREYSNEKVEPEIEIIPGATVYIDRLVRCRHFNQDIPRPQHLTYVLFGDSENAYLDHYIAQDPDFQHLIALPEVPTWLSASQIEAGVEVSFIGMGSTPITCQNPLIEDSYQVMFEGLPDASEELRVGAKATVWYSTGNLLNATDPCANPAKPG
jgi:hypothetical protein